MTAGEERTTTQLVYSASTATDNTDRRSHEPAKKFVRLFCDTVRKNLDELFGQFNTCQIHLRIYVKQNLRLYSSNL